MRTSASCRAQGAWHAAPHQMRWLARDLLLLTLVAWIGGMTPRLARAAPEVGIAAPQTGAEAVGVQIDQAHIFIVPSGDRLQIAEYYLVGNSGPSPYAGILDEGQDVPTTVAFGLPEDATNLSFDGPGLGERYVGDTHRFADTLPIPPGTATVEIGFSYELSSRDQLELARSIDAPVAATVLIVSGEGIGLSGEGLTFTGDMETRMGVAASYRAEPREVGRSLTVQLVSREVTGMTPPAAGRSETLTPSRTRHTAVEIAIGASVLVIVGVALDQTWLSRSLPSMPESARATIERIADLDARREAGQIVEDAYHLERDALVWDVKRSIRRER